MVLHLIALFLGVSILFYCLFAGADFGAGILECFKGSRRRADQQELVTHAMGPVWEANHVWLILALVILFNGFPQVYSQLSITFHIPLTLMLLGVILRGCAFTFRHYDAIKDESQYYYSLIFKVSSLITPMILGMIAGGMMTGRVPSHPTGGYADQYIYPWLNGFSFSIGVFVCVLFSFLAAVYLTGETEDPELSSIFEKRAQVLNVLGILSGLLVFLSAQMTGFPLASAFFSDQAALICMGLATLIVTPLWWSMSRRKKNWARLLAGAQVTFILLGWYEIQAPILIARDAPMSSTSLTIYNTAAPDSALIYLLYALLAGSAVIFPALFFLLRIFKRGDTSSDIPDPLVNGKA